MSSEDPLTIALHGLRALTDGADTHRVGELQERLAADRLRILLVGEAKRGKSTLGNALLGRDVLPSGVIPLTSVTTTVRRGTTEGVTVRSADGTEHAATVADLARFVTEAGNPDNRLGVVEVTVCLTRTELPDRVDLVDTPGMGSVFEHNTEEAGASLESMDAAVLVLTSDPPISASERSLLQRVQRLSVHSVIVINKVDRLSEEELEQVRAFTRAAVAELGAAPPDLFLCSARDGLAARLSGDAAGWKASGVAGLWEALTGYLAEHRRDALVRSVAAATARLAAELVDEAGVARAAEQLRAQDRLDQLQAFRDRLAGLGRRRVEALAVARADAEQLRRDLDRSAVEHGRLAADAVAGEVRRAVQPFAASGTAGQVEDAGRAVLAELVPTLVEQWRREQAQRLDDGLRQMCTRQQELLDGAVEDLRQAGREYLGVDLHAQAEVVGLPEATRFYYTLGPEMGWNAPVDAAVRRRLPGRWGRHRAVAMLASEVVRLVDVHHGRARADFQARLQEASRAVERAVASAYRDPEARMTTALALPSAGEEHDDEPRNDAGGRLEQLIEVARQLDVVLGRTDG